MDRIIVWGTGKRAAMYHKWLISRFDVVAYVDTTRVCGNVYGIPIIPKDDLEKYDFIRIALLVETDAMDKAISEIRDVSDNLVEKTVSIDALVFEHGCDDYIRFTGNRQVEVISSILKASDEEISDYDWMYSKVVSYGVFCFNNQKHWFEQEPDYHWTVYGLQQIPEEFAEFCIFLSGLRNVSSAAEVGVYRGRSAFFISAVLLRHNPGLKYKLIDIFDRMSDYDRFKELLPCLEKSIPSSSADHKEEAFDFVFIDADHSYDASIADYENVGKNVSVLAAFHDIYAHEYDHENGGTVRTWKEVVERTPDSKHIVFSRDPDKWMGIGCVMVNNNAE